MIITTAASFGVGFNRIWKIEKNPTLWLSDARRVTWTVLSFIFLYVICAFHVAKIWHKIKTWDEGCMVKSLQSRTSERQCWKSCPLLYLSPFRQLQFAIYCIYNRQPWIVLQVVLNLESFSDHFNLQRHWKKCLHVTTWCHNCQNIQIWALCNWHVFITILASWKWLPFMTFLAGFQQSKSMGEAGYA